MRCRKSRDIPFDSIIVGRTDDPKARPGPDALVKQCSRCKHDVWVAPQTVIDTGLRIPLFCWGCFYEMVEEEISAANK